MSDSDVKAIAAGSWMAPEAILRYEASTSRGPGGQNVNKVHTRMTLCVALSDLAATIEPVAVARLEKIAAKRINQDGILRIDCDEHRSQQANKRAVRDRLYTLLRRALARPKRRRKTKVPRAARERRIQNKKHRGRLKSGRRERLSGDD